MTDPVADMLTRLRNAINVSQTEITLPHSALKEKVASTLAANHFLKDVATEQIDGRKKLKITIADKGEKIPITEIVRLSRPGRRTYVKAAAIPTVKRGRGLVIISTSNGIMTGQDAKSQQLGGELICKVY